MARQRAAELALGEDQLVLARRELDDLHDQIYVLQCAVVDTRRDLEHPMGLAEAVDALRWLLDAAEPLAQRRLGPS